MPNAMTNEKMKNEPNSAVAEAEANLAKVSTNLRKVREPHDAEMKNEPNSPQPAPAPVRGDGQLATSNGQATVGAWSAACSPVAASRALL